MWSVECANTAIRHHPLIPLPTRLTLLEFFRVPKILGCDPGRDFNPDPISTHPGITMYLHPLYVTYPPMYLTKACMQRRIRLLYRRMVALSIAHHLWNMLTATIGMGCPVSGSEEQTRQQCICCFRWHNNAQ